MTDAVVTPIIYIKRMFTGKSSKPSGMIGQQNHALQEPPVVPYKALYGTTGGSCNARFFSHVMMGGTPKQLANHSTNDSWFTNFFPHVVYCTDLLLNLLTYCLCIYLIFSFD